MRKNLQWKLLLTLAVTAVCAWFIIPPSQKIRLGLDLKGGIHLALRVETDDAVKSVLDNRNEALVGEFAKRTLSHRGIESELKTASLLIKGFDAVARDEFTKTINTQLPGYAIAQVGADLRITIPAMEVTRIREEAVNDTLERIRVRVDAFGVAEYTVQRQGINSDRILIQIPGVDDPERVKDLVAKPAFLEFKKVVLPPAAAGGGFRGTETREQLVALFGGQLPADVEAYQSDPNSFDGRMAWWPLSLSSPVTGNELLNARPSRGEMGSAEVQFSLTPDAGTRFEAFTSANIGNQLASLLDKRLIQVATIQDAIRENGRITNIGLMRDADDLALKLRSGALPASTTVLEERTVGPSLGADSVRQGVTAALAGLIISVGFMVFYYKGSGINAVVALSLNVLLILGIMSGFGATLTLPGIAGVILTFGMALDANVLIFERIREEMRLGKPVRTSVEAGFQKAFRTILDSNLTTVIAAVLLFQFGTGPIKGFAFTLVIGLAASMFTAIFVSRMMFEFILGEGKRVDRLSI